MDERAVPTDPFVEHAETRLVELSPERAVVSQPAASFLDNHVGVRHASALFTAGHEASRALVSGRLPGGAEAALVQSDVHYTNVGFGTVTSEAEPVGEEWDALPGALASGEPVELSARVTGRDDAGKTVFTVDERWTVGPAQA
jgi:acyl-coenzyme A thioesterase PaaI-like protein